MKKTNDVGDELAQQERSNNNCYASTFRYTSRGPVHCV